MFETTPATNESPTARAREAAVRALESDMAELMGVINAANGRLVSLVGHALAKDLWKQWGVHSPSHWLGWQAGMTSAHAEGIVKLAERRTELPSAIAALEAGELSLDSATAIARRAPASCEATITELARSATIGQLTYCLKKHRYDPDTEKARPTPREDQQRSFTSGTDRKGWWCKGRLSPDEGAVMDRAIRTARDDRFRALDANRPAGTEAPQVALADGFLAVGEASLAAGAAAHPGSDRYLVHLHLDASPTADDPTGVLSLHLGQPLPAALQGLLTCDAAIRPVFEVHGTPISIGRRTRVINRLTRRAIEHRDSGCRVPGCGQTFGLDIHHIVHWEHHGSTDTDNLITLCRRHHRLHHQGALGLAGNADLPLGTDGSVVFTDPFGRPLDATGRPTPKHPTHTPAQAAAGLDITPEPGAYRHPLGERLQTNAVHFAPRRPYRPPTPATTPAPHVASPMAPPTDGPSATPTATSPTSPPTDGPTGRATVPGGQPPGPGQPPSATGPEPDLRREPSAGPEPGTGPPEARPAAPRGSPRHEAA